MDENIQQNDYLILKINRSRHKWIERRIWVQGLVLLHDNRELTSYRNWYFNYLTLTYATIGLTWEPESGLGKKGG